ncbi:LOXH1-like protein, partial [Mya arenaria]
VIIDDCDNSITYTFPCQRWLSKDEDDGQIFRDLVAGVGATDSYTGYPYIITVSTGDYPNAGTDANVFVLLHNGKKKQDSGKVWLSDRKFKRGMTEIFNINLQSMLSPLTSLEIGHDDTGVAAGWHCEQVIVYCPNTGIEQFFPCRKWLSTSEGDGLIQRTLYEDTGRRKKKDKKITWNVWVKTSDINNAGTDANVRICLYGKKGKSEEIQLDNKGDDFEKGQVDHFKAHIEEIGTPYKLRIDMEIVGAKEKYAFECNRWLADDEDDFSIVRELPAQGPGIKNPLPLEKYKVQVFTGSKSMAGTNANVYVNIFGERGDTGVRFLKKSQNMDKFEKGKMDEFVLEAVSVLKLTKIRIGHDGKGVGAGWYLDKVVVSQIGETKYDQEFVCQSAGTDANVYLIVYGEKGDTGQLMLRQSNNRNKFERGKTDIFKLEATNIGKIKRIKIGHDGANLGAGWFLDEVKIMVPSRGEQYLFACHRWLASDEHDSQLEPFLMKSQSGLVTRKMLEPMPTSSYSCTEQMGKLRSATCGTRQTTSNRACAINSRIGHDGKGMFAGWFLEKMLIQRRPRKGTKKFHQRPRSASSRDRDNDRRDDRRSPRMSRAESRMGNLSDSDDSDISSVSQSRRLQRRMKSPKQNLRTVREEEDVYDGDETEDYWFLVNRWFARSEDDKQIVRELIPTDENGRPLKGGLEVRVFTGDVSGAGTDSNVFLSLHGDKGDTGERELKDSSTNMNKFERNQEDVFIVKAIELGKLVKLKIRHDNKNMGSAWFLDRVEVDDPKMNKTYFFPCQRWLSTKEDDGQISRELVPVDASLKSKLTRQDSKAIRNEIALETKAAMQTYHVKVTTGTVWGAGTDANVHIILYGEKDDTGTVLLKSSKTHSNKFEGGNMDEFLVEAVNIGSAMTTRAAARPGFWTRSSLSVRPSVVTGRIPYEVRTLTSDLSSAGTSANVYIQLYGRDIATQQKDLCVSKLDRKDKFKRGQEDVFIVELEDVGEKIEKIRIGHDNSGIGSGWHLNMVKIRRLHESGKGSITYIFPCNRWLARDEDDFATERELVAEKAVQEMDVIKLEAANLGNIYKIRIRHDNSGFSPAWYLDNIEIIDGSDNQRYVFHCERWLAKNKDDMKIERSFYVKGYDGEMSSTGTLRSTKYGSVASLNSIGSDPFSKSPVLTRKQLAMEEIPEGPTIPYTVRVTTGEGEDNGTSSNVWIKVMGPRKKHTGQLFLELAQKNKFAAGSTEIFSIEAVDVDEVRKIEVGHDGTAPGTGWFIKEIEVDMPTKGKHYTFTCKQWLARDKGDGRTSRIFSVEDGISSVSSYKPLIAYEVTVITGDVEEAGTDQKITMTVFGAKGPTTPQVLEKSGERFERDRADLIKLELEDVAPIKKMRIETDGNGSRPDWYCEKVELRNMASGTDANVYVTLFGDNGDSGPIHLKKSDTNKDPFENDQIDVFTINGILSLGELSKCRVWHDNKGFGAAWHLEHIEVEDLGLRKSYKFHCDKWLSKSDGDKQILRELTCSTPARGAGSFDSKDKSTYEIEVKTSDKKEGGTIHNGWIILEGDKKTSKVFKLENSAANKILRKGNVDNFSFTSPPLGVLEACIVGAYEREDRPLSDVQGREAQWHCFEISVTDVVKGKKYIFPCKDWITIQERVVKREGKVLQVKKVEESQTAVVRSLATVNYEVVVYTGDKFGAGTNANVHIVLYGEHGDTGKRALTQSMRDLFERKQVDKFNLEAVDLGQLQKLHVEHDNSGWRPKWYLDRIEVINSANNTTTVFPCEKWLDKDSGDECIYPYLFGYGENFVDIDLYKFLCFSCDVLTMMSH